MNKVAEVERVLMQLNMNNPNVIGSVVVTNEGTSICSTLPEEIDHQLIGTIGSYSVSFAQRLCREARHNSLYYMLMGGTEGKSVFIGVGDHSVLAVLSKDSDEDVPSLIKLASKVASNLSEILS